MTEPRLIITEPAWQNFSSMYREARTAGEAKTGMEASHHLTATLYFGISALEAFLNQRMRLHMKGAGEEDVIEKLRKAAFVTKIKKWPKEMLDSSVVVRTQTISKLLYYNDVRGTLTHPKHVDHRDYEPLGILDPMEVVDSVAEYISQFLLAAGEPFRYWLWGWNYLCPSKDGHQIALLPESQIVFSMNTMGFPRTPVFPMFASSSDAWALENMHGYAAYKKVADFLETVGHCEPKNPQFPYQPKLCRRWWDPDHQATCGRVTDEAIRHAIEDEQIDSAVARVERMTKLGKIGYVLRFLITGK